MLQPKKTLIRTPKSELTRVTRKATDEEAARFGMKKVKIIKTALRQWLLNLCLKHQEKIFLLN